MKYTSSVFLRSKIDERVVNEFGQYRFWYLQGLEDVLNDLGGGITHLFEERERYNYEYSNQFEKLEADVGIQFGAGKTRLARKQLKDANAQRPLQLPKALSIILLLENYLKRKNLEVEKALSNLLISPAIFQVLGFPDDFEMRKEIDGRVLAAFVRQESSIFLLEMVRGQPVTKTTAEDTLFFLQGFLPSERSEQLKISQLEQRSELKRKKPADRETPHIENTLDVPYVPERLVGFVNLRTSGENKGKLIRSLTEDFLREIGYDAKNFDSLPSRKGSWIGDIFTSLRRSISDPYVTDRVKIAEDLVYGRTSISDAKDLALIISQLNETTKDEQCVIDLGPVIYIRYINEKNESKVFFKKLSVRDRISLNKLNLPELEPQELYQFITDDS